MIDNVCIFPMIVHDQTGEELEIAYLVEGTYIESLELDGPRLMLTFRDPDQRIKNDLQIKELDTFTVSLADTWREAGESFSDQFTVLTCRPDGDTVRIELMAKIVYGMKELARKTRIFTQRGIAEIITAFAGGAQVETGKFPVVENYHCIEGKRPTETLRRIASEQGAHIWYTRGVVRMERFATLFAKTPSIVFTHGTLNAENAILSYTKPSGQVQAQENSARSFTGWNEVEGRVKTSPDMPILAMAKFSPASQTPSPNPFVLGNGPVAKKPAIDFTAYGNLSVAAGQALKLLWRTPDPANPINEGLPAKVVVDSVAHWYSSQKYFTRVKGAVAFEPI